jgi:N-acetylmuramoyl-L-alanine amidase
MFLLVLIISIFLPMACLSAEDFLYHASGEALSRETPGEILHRYHLDQRHLAAFLILNEMGSSWQRLQADKEYKLPVHIYAFTGKTVRTVLDVPMTEAVHIRDYNASLAADNLKPAISDDRKIWVPYDHVLVRAAAGQGVGDLLAQYGLEDRHATAFTRLNRQEGNVIGGILKPGMLYRLPIHIENYNGPTISKALGVTHNDAKKIQAYNTEVYNRGLKPQIWDDHLLWFPYFTRDNDKYGSVYRSFEVTSTQLENCIFYLSAGHGGPDPGTIGVREGETICEDEYSLDITLRLARELERNGARVVVVIQDEGVRDRKFLPGDSDEVFANGQTIADDLKTRLKQRTSLVNRIYANTPEINHQRFLSIHIDFRSNDQTHVDFDLYHHESSRDGQELASILQQTISQNYSSRLGGRNFVGKIIAQPEEKSFFVIRETKMPAVLLELANINNELDQLRFIVIDSRQRIAEWLCDGLILDWQTSLH